MAFAKCMNLKDFHDYFNEISEIKFANLSPYNTVVLVIYDSHSYNNINMFLAIYRSIGYINKIESDEIEAQFDLYCDLMFK